MVTIRKLQLGVLSLQTNFQGFVKMTRLFNDSHYGIIVALWFVRQR